MLAPYPGRGHHPISMTFPEPFPPMIGDCLGFGGAIIRNEFNCPTNLATMRMSRAGLVFPG
jgi:hypothetical protein